MFAPDLSKALCSHLLCHAAAAASAYVSIRLCSHLLFTDDEHAGGGGGDGVNSSYEDFFAEVTVGRGQSTGCFTCFAGTNVVPLLHQKYKY